MYQPRRDDLLSFDDNRLARLDTGPAQRGMHDATRPAFGRVRAPKSRSVTRLLRTKLGRLGHHRPDNRVGEEAGLSRDDLAPLRLANLATQGRTGHGRVA